MRLRHLAGYSFGASKKAVLKFPADTAIRGRSSAPVSAEHSLPWRRPHFQRGERLLPATADGALSRAASPPSTALRETFRRSLPPSHAALPCGGGLPQSSLTLAPPAVKGAYFSLSTGNLTRASKKKALSGYQVVLFQQDAENRGFFPNFSADGLHNRSILSVIPLEFQEIKHQPLPMAQAFRFGRVIRVLIHRYSMMKVQPFSPILSVGGFYG